MKHLLMLFCLCVAISIKAQKPHTSLTIADTTKKIQMVEVSCGQCQFHLHGKGCNLAVRIKGKAYFIDGTSIDDYGDAHAREGFCNAVRKAEVQGKIVNKKYVVRYFKLLD